MSAPFGFPAELVELLDDYELVDEVGRGGAAVVYRARDRTLGRAVAVKVVHPRAASRDDDAVARLAREARMVAQLEHPNIVAVYAIRRLRGGGLALIMPFVAGGTLKTAVLSGGPLAPERAERLLRDVTSALAYAHARGLVHRDVKPENIFLDERSGRALLADFGIARSTTADAMTMTGTAVGTPFYMSPEQVDGETLDGRSDLYSLGLAAWEALTGRRPWDGESLYNVMYKQKHEALPPIEALRPGVSRRLQYIVERMLQKRPGARWAGADALLAQLDHSVLPADYDRWQRALPGRVARFQATEAARVAKPAVSRLTDAGEPIASASTLHFVPGQGGSVGAPGLLFAPTAPGSRAPSEPWIPDAGVATTSLRAGAGVSAYGPPEPSASGIPEDASLSAGDAVDGQSREAAPMRYADLVEPTWGSPEPQSRDAQRWPMPRPRGAVLALGMAGVLATSGWLAADRYSRPSIASIERSSVASGSPRLAGQSGQPGPTAEEVSGRPTTTSVAALTAGMGASAILAAGGRHTCALTLGAGAHCWGANDRGQLGDGGVPRGRAAPLPVTGAFTFTTLAAGAAHSCAVTRLGDAYCWGANGRGQLGDATTVGRNAPVRVAGPATYTSVSAGAAHTCALTTDGAARCWGANDEGQLGNGVREAQLTPTSVQLGGGVTQVAAGGQHSCAVTDAAQLFCWGSNDAGQLGISSAGRYSAVPQRVTAPGRVSAVSLGSAHTCATTDEGALWCWGRNDAGQLGDGSRVARTAPTRVQVGANRPVVAVAAGANHTCALDAAGELWCWGRDTRSGVRAGASPTRIRPNRVGLPERAIAVAAGSEHSCAVVASGGAYCWGTDAVGQLGTARTPQRRGPGRVQFPRGVAVRSTPGRLTAE